VKHVDTRSEYALPFARLSKIRDVARHGLGGAQAPKFLVSPPIEFSPLCNTMLLISNAIIRAQNDRKSTPQRSPDIERFMVGTGNPKEKDERRKGKKKEKEMCFGA